MKLFLIKAGLYTCKIAMVILISMLIYLLSGCTVQFKAKEIELEGHTNTTYEFTGFAWTESTTDISNPTDKGYVRFSR